MGPKVDPQRLRLVYDPFQMLTLEVCTPPDETVMLTATELGLLEIAPLSSTIHLRVAKVRSGGHVDPIDMISTSFRDRARAKGVTRLPSDLIGHRQKVTILWRLLSASNAIRVAMVQSILGTGELSFLFGDASHLSFREFFAFAESNAEVVNMLYRFAQQAEMTDNMPDSDQANDHIRTLRGQLLRAKQNEALRQRITAAQETLLDRERQGKLDALQTAAAERAGKEAAEQCNAQLRARIRELEDHLRTQDHAGGVSQGKKQRAEEGRQAPSTYGDEDWSSS